MASMSAAASKPPEHATTFITSGHYQHQMRSVIDRLPIHGHLTIVGVPEKQFPLQQQLDIEDCRYVVKKLRDATAADAFKV